MTINKKVTGTSSSIPVGLAWGTFSSTAMTLAGAGIAAKLINGEIISWDQAGYAVLTILLISSWIGAMVAAGKIKRRRMVVCLASGVAYMMILLCATALFFGGKYSGVGETALLILCGSIVAVFSGYPGKRRRKPMKTKGHTVKLNKISP